MIPRPFIDDLLARTDIVEVIDSYVPLRKSGKNYSARCPFHEEKTPSFSVNPEKQFYYCFGCGAGGNALSFLMNYSRLEFVEAVEELAARLGLSVPREEEGNSRESSGAPREALYQVLEQAARYFQQQLRDHADADSARAYLQQRGISMEIAENFGLGFAPPGWRNLLDALGDEKRLNEAGLLSENTDGRVYDRFRARLMFPIYNQRSRIVGFGGRVLDDSKPKYLNSPETPVFQKGRELYALERVRKVRPAHIIVVEGYMDVVALAQYGIDNAVAALGTAFSNEHAKALFRSADQIIFCFDGDEAGQRAAGRALEIILPFLDKGRDAGFVFLPAGEDPDTLVRSEGGEAFRRRMGGALGAVDFLFAHLQAQVDLSKRDAPMRLLELAKPILAGLPEGPIRHFLSARLADVDTRNWSRLLSSDDENRARQTVDLQRSARQRYAKGAPVMHMTPLRTVVGLLVQQPALAEEVNRADYARLAQLDLPGIELLLALLEFIQAHPKLHTGMILEHWRDTAHAPALAKLAAWQHSLPEAGVASEFRDALGRVLAAHGEQRLDILMNKSKMSALSAAEKEELKQLLADRG
jgi:DNA primase